MTTLIEKPGTALPPKRKTAPTHMRRGFAPHARKPKPADPWEGWKPVWEDKNSPHALQERKAPTESVRLRESGGAREDSTCQRRIVDARLWDQMSPPEQQAALMIAMAYETMSRGLGFTTSNYARIPGARGVNVADMHGRLINHYIEWTRACHAPGISHSMILDVIVFGISCKALDRDRRVRHGTARKNLIEGLRLYCALRGWPV